MEPKMRTNIKFVARATVEVATGATVYGFITKHMQRATRAQKIRSSAVGYVVSTMTAALVKKYADPKIDEFTDKVITYVQNLNKEN